MKKKDPTSIDQMVGQLLKRRRRELHLTQEQLAQRLDLVPQQIQKYEKGANRVPAGRLYEFADALNVSVDYFFAGAAEHLGPEFLSSMDELTPSETVMSSEGQSLLAAYDQIPDDDVKKLIRDFVLKMAKPKK